MNILNSFSHKPLKNGFSILISLVLIYVILGLFIFPNELGFSILGRLSQEYQNLVKEIGNRLFNYIDAGVIIKDQELVFFNNSSYQLSNYNSLSNWPKALLFRNWSILVMATIWLTGSPIRKKVLFSSLFLITHLISVVSGLYLLGIAGPALYNYKPDFILYPTIAGTFTMFGLLALWLKNSKNEIQRLLQKIKINNTLSDRKINEILIVFFFFLLLRSFIVPFFDFKPYANFLLVATNLIASIFDYNGIIEDVYLTGENGAIFIDKGCMAFVSLFVFAAIVYLTRLKNDKSTWLYIVFGLFALQIINILRLTALFIVVQGENGFVRATKHHEIYNIIIYVIIFVLWVVWFEFFVGRKNLKPTSK